MVEPGDILLYRSEGFIPWLIRVKTWSDISHVETYIGADQSFSARNEGVGIFPFRLDGLKFVLRPKLKYDPFTAGLWRKKVVGQKYDWLGFLVFYLAAKQGARDRMFCSEACTRDARAGGIEPFQSDYDADRVAPVHFLTSSSYYKI